MDGVAKRFTAAESRRLCLGVGGVTFVMVLTLMVAQARQPATASNLPVPALGWLALAKLVGLAAVVSLAVARVSWLITKKFIVPVMPAPGAGPPLSAGAGLLTAHPQPSGEISTGAYHQALIEQMEAVVYRTSLSPGAGSEFISPQIFDLLGYTPEEWLAKPTLWQSAIHRDDRQRVIAAVSAARQAQQPYRLEYRLCHRSGYDVWIYESAVLVHDQAGQVVGYQGTVTNISDRMVALQKLQRTEAQLYQAQKMEVIGRLAGGVAHDFNNLLTIILGYSSILHARLQSADPLRKVAEEITRAGERASRLTGQLLAFSRKQVINSQPLQVNQVVQEMQRMLERLIGEQISLQIDLEPELYQVLADAGQMEQVILNLAVNARDAMPQGGTLRLQTRNVTLTEPDSDWQPLAPAGSFVMVTVTDTGVGIDEAVRQHLFEPFFTTKPAGQGTGLGLATIYGIITQAGGHVHVTSKVGAGSTFRVLLPRLAVKGAVENNVYTGTSTELAMGSGQILLVEDEADVRQLAAEVLQSCGYQVVMAANGVEALRLCATMSPPPDLLITDMVMPEMGGLELAGKLCERFPALRVMYISGYPVGLNHHQVSIPDNAYLQKPFVPSALARRVRQLLEATPVFPAPAPAPTE